MSPRQLLFLFPVTWLLTSCANFGVQDVYQEPSFDHQNTRLTGLTWTGVTGRSTVTMNNPNAFRLPVSGFDAALFLDGEPWVDLETPAMSGIAARGSTTLTFDWDLVAEGLLRRAKEAYEAGEAELELRLNPTLEVPVLGPRQVDWAHSFTVPVPKLPTMRLADWAVEDVSLSSLTVRLDLLIDNPNRFGLAAGPMQVGIDGGAGRLAGMTLDPLSLNGGEKRVKTTRATLSFGDLGLSLVNALRTGQWPQDLALNWQSPLSSPDLGLDLPDISGRLSP